MRMNSVRMLWGKGVRAGLYPLSDTEAYWFTTKNCPSVCSPGCHLTVASSKTILDILCWTLGTCPGQHALRAALTSSRCQ